MRRRAFLQTAGAATGLALFGGLARASNTQALSRAGSRFGPLAASQVPGLFIPDGFTARVVATSGELVAGSTHRWHPNPDGGATFAQPDGGWIYVSNDESGDGRGGVSMIRFDAQATIVDAAPILTGTSRNCAGGPTPWGTWLSCEEYDLGRVWECDPSGQEQAILRPAMGTFAHEAAAADPERQVIYLTEDKKDGGLYRFVPDVWGDLSAGSLQVLGETNGALEWLHVPDPRASETPTRYQVQLKTFAGGEGAWYDDGLLYFTTKLDNRVWTYEPATNSLQVIYDIATSPTPILKGVDNVTTSTAGDLYVCEDGGSMEVVALTAAGAVEPFLQIDVAKSEVTGVAFDPSGTRMYVSSQRWPGQTFEITGPFVPEPVAPEPSPTPQPTPTAEPTLTPQPTAEPLSPTPSTAEKSAPRRNITTVGSMRTSEPNSGHR